MRNMDKNVERKTTLNVSISAEDKKFLKMYALEHDTTVAALIEAYVEKLRNDADANDVKYKNVLTLEERH